LTQTDSQREWQWAKETWSETEELYTIDHLTDPENRANTAVWESMR